VACRSLVTIYLRHVTPVTISIVNGVLRSDSMEAAVWTAIGLLAATSLGTLFYLGARIDAVSARIDARFDGIDTRFDAVNARIDALAGRIDANGDATNARIDALAGRIDAHLQRHAG
jgi:hypothetical protein